MYTLFVRCLYVGCCCDLEYMTAAILFVTKPAAIGPLLEIRPTYYSLIPQFLC